MRTLAAFLFFWFLAPAPAAAQAIEVVAAMDLAPGNITVTGNGRVIVSLHQFFDPPYPVAELDVDGRATPFPPPSEGDADSAVRPELDTVLGLQADRRGVVWLLDNGMRGGTIPRLVAWDTERNRLARLVHLPPPTTVETSFVNDLAVDLSHEAVYIADPARGGRSALILVDLRTGMSVRVLEGHPSVIAEDVPLRVDGRPLRVRKADGTVVEPKVGVNPIALDRDDRWLYFGPMHGSKLYRIPTTALLGALREGHTRALASRVEVYAERPVCDGIAIDDAGNIYVSDIGANAVGVIEAAAPPGRRYRILVADPRLSWPDAFSFGPDGLLYTVASRLQGSAPLNAGKRTARPPFPVLRVTPLAPGVVGR